MHLQYCESCGRHTAHINGECQICEALEGVQLRALREAHPEVHPEVEETDEEDMEC